MRAIVLKTLGRSLKTSVLRAPVPLNTGEMNGNH
jgi:hypothetical protein